MNSYSLPRPLPSASHHSPCSLRLGFSHVVRFVPYDPQTPFTVCGRGHPFSPEGEARRYCKRKLEHTIEQISKFPEQERERLASHMLGEDGKGNHEVDPSYDALLMRYRPELLPALNRHMNPDSQPEPKPLPTPAVSVTRWVTKLEKNSDKS